MAVHTNARLVRMTKRAINLLRLAPRESVHLKPADVTVGRAHASAQAGDADDGPPVLAQGCERCPAVWQMSDSALRFKPGGCVRFAASVF